MQVQGSFKIPQFDVSRNLDLRGRGHVPTVTRNEAKAIFLLAVREYLIAAAARVPVLTGATKRQFAIIIEGIESRIQEFAGELEWRSSLIDGGYIPVALDTSSADIEIKPTARQIKDSPYELESPDETASKKYKKPQYYHDFPVKTRGEWRGFADDYTYAEAEFFHIISNGGWIQNFIFSVTTEDDGEEYFPEDYRPLEAVEDVFGDALERIYEERFINALTIFVTGAENDVPF